MFCPGPSSLNRPHPPHSQAHRDFTAWRLIRDAFAVRERLGDPRAVPGFRCSFLPGMPSSPTPGSPTSNVPELRCRHGLRRLTTSSALPKLPQSVPRGFRISWLLWFASATACQVARPPCTDQTGTPQPSGTFTSRLSTDRSPSPSLDITTTVTGLLLLAGLSPAGMAASLAARSKLRNTRSEHLSSENGLNSGRRADVLTDPRSAVADVPTAMQRLCR